MKWPTTEVLGEGSLETATPSRDKAGKKKGIFACRIHICDENSSNSYDFPEKCKKKKKNRKMNNFGNFC